MKKFIQEFEEIREDLYKNVEVGAYAIGGTFGDEVTAFDEGLTREGEMVRNRFNHYRGGHPIASDHGAAAFVITLDRYRMRQIEEEVERVKNIQKNIDIAYDKIAKIIIEKTLEFAEIEEADKWTQEMTLEEVEDFEKNLDEEAEKAFEAYRDMVKHLAMTLHRVKSLNDPNYYFKI